MEQKEKNNNKRGRGEENAFLKKMPYPDGGPQTTVLRVDHGSDGQQPASRAAKTSPKNTKLNTYAHETCKHTNQRQYHCCKQTNTNMDIYTTG
jgi:hypothetical protein